MSTRNTQGITNAIQQIHALTLPDPISEITAASSSLSQACKQFLEAALNINENSEKVHLQLARSAKDAMRFLYSFSLSVFDNDRFGLTNICQTAAVDKELYNSLQTEALQLNYKIKVSLQLCFILTRQGSNCSCFSGLIVKRIHDMT